MVANQCTSPKYMGPINHFLQPPLLIFPSPPTTPCPSGFPLMQKQVTSGYGCWNCCNHGEHGGGQDASWGGPMPLPGYGFPPLPWQLTKLSNKSPNKQHNQCHNVPFLNTRNWDYNHNYCFLCGNDVKDWPWSKTWESKPYLDGYGSCGSWRQQNSKI